MNVSSITEQFSYNGGSVVATSSRSRTQEDDHLSWNTNNNGDNDQDKPGAEAGRSRYFITLAPISSCDEEDMDTSSIYDSIHNLETDFCRDSDDYSSDTASTVSGDAQQEVIEFDVVTASSDDGDYLYLEDSSSGSDNYILDKQIFVVHDNNKSKERLWDTVVESSYSSGTTTSTGEDGLQDESAEDSTDEDPELRPADYWKCVKCNNSQNNPLYRYCEKCYQLRKNYFPPRPRLSKSRTRKNPRSNSSSGSHHHHHHNHQNEQSSSDCMTSSGEDEEEHTRRSAKKFKASPTSSSSLGKIESSDRTTVVQSSSSTLSSEEGIDNNNAKDNNSTNGESSHVVGIPESLASETGQGSVQLRMTRHGVSNNNNNISNRKRPISSQTTDEDDPNSINDHHPKKQKLHSSGDEEEEGTSSVISSGVDSQETMANQRPKSLLLSNVLDSGFCSSSYSSGQESIPSPVNENSTTEQCLITTSDEKGEREKQLESLSSQGSSSLISTQPDLIYSNVFDTRTVSLSRDFHCGPDKGSYSDSETYRRTSTKCVVNKGEANAIVRRLQGELLMGSKSSGVAEMQRVVDKSKGVGGELKATKSLMEQYQEQKEEDRLNNLCIICVSEPKDSAFVHTRSLHICCCYKCAIKVWNKKKRCPICNCKVKNVLKCYVH